MEVSSCDTLEDHVNGGEKVQYLRQIKTLKAPKNMTGELLVHVAMAQVLKSVKMKR